MRRSSLESCFATVTRFRPIPNRRLKNRSSAPTFGLLPSNVLLHFPVFQWSLQYMVFKTSTTFECRHLHVTESIACVHMRHKVRTFMPPASCDGATCVWTLANCFGSNSSMNSKSALQKLEYKHDCSNALCISCHVCNLFENHASCPWTDCSTLPSFLLCRRWKFSVRCLMSKFCLCLKFASSEPDL